MVDLEVIFNGHDLDCYDVDCGGGIADFYGSIFFIIDDIEYTFIVNGSGSDTVFKIHEIEAIVSDDDGIELTVEDFGRRHYPTEDEEFVMNAIAEYIYFHLGDTLQEWIDDMCDEDGDEYLEDEEEDM